MASDGVSLRETRLGVITHFLDKLPPRFSNPIFIFLWAAMLLGWIVPAALALRQLLRSSRLKRDSNLHRMVEPTKNGYSREKAPELLELLTESPARTDKILNDISVRDFAAA
jgi:hypothetical protein